MAEDYFHMICHVYYLYYRLAHCSVFKGSNQGQGKKPVGLET